MEIQCLTLRRKNGHAWEWLITNGLNMGRWTCQFGVNCLADTHDCKEFARNKFHDSIQDYILEEARVVLPVDTL